MELSYSAVCFDLFGTLVEADGGAVHGAAEALNRLPAERWAIVTSCGSGHACALLEHARLPLPRILIAADDVERGKPAPDPYVLAARKLECDPKNVLVIEDSRDGISAGRAAGMDVLAILRGRGLTFAGAATFQVEQLSDVRWSTCDGSILVTL